MDERESKERRFAESIDESLPRKGEPALKRQMEKLRIKEGGSKIGKRGESLLGFTKIGKNIEGS